MARVERAAGRAASRSLIVCLMVSVPVTVTGVVVGVVSAPTGAGHQAAQPPRPAAPSLGPHEPVAGVAVSTTDAASVRAAVLQDSGSHVSSRRLRAALASAGATVVGLSPAALRSSGDPTRGGDSAWESYSILAPGVRSAGSLSWRTDTWRVVEVTSVPLSAVDPSVRAPLVRLEDWQTGEQQWLVAAWPSGSTPELTTVASALASSGVHVIVFDRDGIGATGSCARVTKVEETGLSVATLASAAGRPGCATAGGARPPGTPSTSG